ncbi:MAG: phage integrase SAM-like domain-containing protein [Fluviicola sp.]
MVNLKLKLDTRRAKMDGSYPIVFRIMSKGKWRDISTGFSSNVKNWDDKNEFVKIKSEKEKLVAQRIRNQELILLTRLRDYELKYPSSIDVQHIKSYLTKEHDSKISVFEFWTKEIGRLEKANNQGGVRNYKSALVGVTKYTSLKISFQQLNYQWLISLETSMRTEGLKTNSIGVYMRTLRAVYNKAINHEIVDAKYYPFRKYKIKSQTTEPRTLGLEEMKSFFNHSPSEFTHEAWNYGRLILMLRGINFADLAVLTKENIKGNRIVYQRRKTDKRYSVKMHPLVEKIFKEYQCDNRVTLLPILSNSEFEDKKRCLERIDQQRKNINKQLGLISKELELSEKLTTYVFRYSHANICKALGYSKDLISESLGHAYGLSVSSCYLEDYDLGFIDEMNDDVIQNILFKLEVQSLNNGRIPKAPTEGTNQPTAH